MLVPAESIYVSSRLLVKINTNYRCSFFKIFLQCLMFCVLTIPCLGPSLQLHVWDVWPDKGHRKRIAQAYGKFLKISRKIMKIIVKK